eukprot:TRINITY_DN12092_c0_g2_i1.p6 TRINITY_DN12092_c0_g2~~TRINITY_DN12092_c0_g2_i1.p6  ORF type:complete len:138 (+),score=1.41 TRINITY_DN12092_c0_g2_i1:11-424(+)
MFLFAYKILIVIYIRLIFLLINHHQNTTYAYLSPYKFDGNFVGLLKIANYWALKQRQEVVIHLFYTFVLLKFFVIFSSGYFNYAGAVVVLQFREYIWISVACLPNLQDCRARKRITRRKRTEKLVYILGNNRNLDDM